MAVVNWFNEVLALISLAADTMEIEKLVSSTLIKLIRE